MQKLIDYLTFLIKNKFTGDVIVRFFKGGIRLVKRSEDVTL